MTTTIKISKSELQAAMNSASKCGFMQAEGHAISLSHVGNIATTEQGATDMSQYAVELMNLENRAEPELSAMDFGVISENAEDCGFDIEWVA
ncbi:MAG: hypothetical protein JRD89_01510 [Deltaproteobacteria bacterium]|nr:hypothetical protein [Deltaproteobacteria bacterium]